MPDSSTAVTPNPATDAELDPSKLVKQTPTSPTGNKKILVVEDEPDARTMFVDLLSMEGYDVSSAVDGVDALAKAAAEKFDLILLDIVMPNKDGLEVLEEMKADEAKYGKPIVVMLTNISGDAAVEKAMELGAVGFKLKIGTEPDQLIKDVAAFLAGKVEDKPADTVMPSTVEMEKEQMNEVANAAATAAPTEPAMPAPTAETTTAPVAAPAPMAPEVPPAGNVTALDANALAQKPVSNVTPVDFGAEENPEQEKKAA